MKSGRILAAAALAAALAWPVAAQGEEKKPISESKSSSMTATVEAVNTTARELTLKGPKGNLVVVGVPEEVKRFNEIKVGDRLTIKYTEALAVELHKADSAAKLGMTAEGSIDRGPAGQRPAGVVSKKVTATVAVKAVDMAAPSITIESADGVVQSVRVRDKKNLEGVKPGDKITITYTEAVALQVSDAPK